MSNKIFGQKKETTPPEVKPENKMTSAADTMYAFFKDNNFTMAEYGTTLKLLTERVTAELQQRKFGK